MFSRGLLSSGMISMISNVVINRRFGFWFKLYLKDLVLVCVTLIFFSRIISVANSSPTTFMMDRIRIWIPFLILPFGFVVMRKLPVLFIRFLLLFFVFMMTAVCLQLSIQYFIHFNDINAAYSYGHTIETPFSHIRFSLMVALCCVVCFYLLTKKYVPLTSFEKPLLAFCLVVLVVFIHLLAVRSGLLALYLCVAFWLIRKMFLSRHKMVWLSAGLFFIIAIIASVKFVPSLNQKFSYMKYDLQQYFGNGNPAVLSDASRLLSIQNGITLFKNNPVTGVGIGDLKTEMSRLYNQYPDMPAEKRFPHNQFIYVLAAGGLLSFILFMCGVFVPLFYSNHYKNMLFLSFFVIMISSFLTEATLEEQIGTGMFSVFLLMLHSAVNLQEL